MASLRLDPFQTVVEIINAEGVADYDFLMGGGVSEIARFDKFGDPTVYVNYIPWNCEHESGVYQQTIGSPTCRGIITTRKHSVFQVGLRVKYRYAIVDGDIGVEIFGLTRKSGLLIEDGTETHRTTSSSLGVWKSGNDNPYVMHSCRAAYFKKEPDNDTRWALIEQCRARGYKKTISSSPHEKTYAEHENAIKTAVAMSANVEPQRVILRQSAISFLKAEIEQMKETYGG
jgi:hypothetical protein